MDADQVFLGHQPGHPLAPNPGPESAELAVDPGRSIGASRALVDLPDGVGQIGVLDAPRGGWLVGPGVVTAAGDLGRSAQSLDRVLISMSGDEPIAAYR